METNKVVVNISGPELEFFKTIKDKIKSVVDIGCRENVEYFLIQPDIIYHLFDINPTHLESITTKIGDNPNINLYGVGVGKVDRMDTYSTSSESIFRQWGSNHHQVQIYNFEEFLKNKNITDIGFLKMDIEGSEPEILSFTHIIKDIKYVQFEFGGTWDDAKLRPQPDVIYDLEGVIKLYEETHNFYYMRDPAHPISQHYKGLLISLTPDVLTQLLHYHTKGYGGNMIMINKKENYE